MRGQFSALPRSAPTRIAARMSHIDPFYVMEIQRRAFELEAQGRRIVHMEIGQPDFGTPEPVVEAVNTAMQRETLGYTDALGSRALREAIAAFYYERFGLNVPASRIIVTAGASGAFLTLSGTLFSAGDEVLIPTPGYPCNRHFVAMFDATPRALPVSVATRFQPTAQDVSANWNAATRGIVIASPSNPTGTSISAAELERIADAVRVRTGVLIVDEIYQGLSYGDSPNSALAINDELIVVNSFSKYFCMTGWRIGWMVVPEDAVPALERFAQNAFISPSGPAQVAALAALQPDSLAIFEERRATFARRRDRLLPALLELGFDIPVVPDGAFYIYADCSRFSDDSFAFAFELLEQTGVALTPGRDFGGEAPERYVRFAYTRGWDDLEEAVERLGRYLPGRVR
jgi:aspartate/methionine/tyrosine aminotransferase